MIVSASTWDVTEPVETYVTVSFSGDDWEDMMNRVLTGHLLELEVTRCDTGSTASTEEFEWILHVGDTSVPVTVNMDNMEAYKRFTTYTNHDVFFLDVESLVWERTRRNSTNGSVTFLVSIL